MRWVYIGFLGEGVFQSGLVLEGFLWPDIEASLGIGGILWPHPGASSWIGAILCSGILKDWWVLCSWLGGILSWPWSQVCVLVEVRMLFSCPLYLTLGKNPVAILLWNFRETSSLLFFPIGFVLRVFSEKSDKYIKGHMVVFQNRCDPWGTSFLTCGPRQCPGELSYSLAGGCP